MLWWNSNGGTSDEDASQLEAIQAAPEGYLDHCCRFLEPECPGSLSDAYPLAFLRRSWAWNEDDAYYFPGFEDTKICIIRKICRICRICWICRTCLNMHPARSILYTMCCSLCPDELVTQTNAHGRMAVPDGSCYFWASFHSSVVLLVSLWVELNHAEKIVSSRSLNTPNKGITGPYYLNSSKFDSKMPEKCVGMLFYRNLPKLGVYRPKIAKFI